MHRGDYRTLAKLVGETGQSFETLAHLVADLRIEPTFQINGVGLYSEDSVKRICAAVDELPGGRARLNRRSSAGKE
jgi:hypothetical protein